METMTPAKPPLFNTLRIAYLVAAIAVVLFMLVYWYQPLPGGWNDFVYYASILLAAWLAAVLGVLVYRQYLPGDPPRKVWGFFALGLAGWACGELVWLLLRPYYETFPDVFITDVFWLGSYFFFAASIALQYRLIFMPTPRQERRLWALAGAGALAAVALLTWSMRRAGLNSELSLSGMIVYACYPVGDVLLGLLGLYLSSLFGRGLWGRAWWGLVAFALSDGISFWYANGGEALVSEAMGSYLSLMVDTLYFLAYILLALACLGQLLLLKQAGPPHRMGQENDFADQGVGLTRTSG